MYTYTYTKFALGLGNNVNNNKDIIMYKKVNITLLYK